MQLTLCIAANDSDFWPHRKLGCHSFSHSQLTTTGRFSCKLVGLLLSWRHRWGHFVAYRRLQPCSTLFSANSLFYSPRPYQCHFTYLVPHKISTTLQSVHFVILLLCRTFATVVHLPSVFDLLPLLQHKTAIMLAGTAWIRSTYWCMIALGSLSTANPSSFVLAARSVSIAWPTSHL